MVYKRVAEVLAWCSARPGSRWRCLRYVRPNLRHFLNEAVSDSDKGRHPKVSELVVDMSGDVASAYSSRLGAHQVLEDHVAAGRARMGGYSVGSERLESVPRR
jgi:hypothetical protein